MAKDSYNDTSTSERPAKTGSIGGGTASASYPKAVGTPDVQKNDPTGSPRVSVKTLQSAIQSTPGNRDVRPSKVDSYEDGEV